ncbi:MAG: DUF3299 domain-containing protein [Rhodocyclaceae bacterium]|nr:DUF3299 domain-containing protein [Rhodocyclaceae bacterium]
MKNCRVKLGGSLRRGLGLAVFLLALGAFAQDSPRVGERVTAPAQKPPPAGVADLEWEDLMPKGWNARDALKGVDLASLSDNDPRANELLAKLREETDRAPVVKSLDGKKVRIAGFTVTLERNDKGIREFLLVPYFGACIHTPPPPANQIVHVLPATPVPPDQAIFPVWVTGTLRTVSGITAEGATGYRIADAQVEPYPWKRRR